MPNPQAPAPRGDSGKDQGAGQQQGQGQHQGQGPNQGKDRQQGKDQGNGGGQGDEPGLKDDIADQAKKAGKSTAQNLKDAESNAERAEEVAAAAGKAAGVEPAVRGLIVLKKAAKRGLPVLLTLLMAFVLNGTVNADERGGNQGLSGKGTSELEKVVDKTLIEQWKDAVKDAGSVENGGVPWTLLAALSITATEAGRYSPYDSCDRAASRRAPVGNARTAKKESCSTPPSAYPQVKPAVGSKDNAEALGPYLLRSGLLKSGVDAQDFRSTKGIRSSEPKTATDFVAGRLFQLRGELQKEGFGFKTADAAAASWAEAVRRLGVSDPAQAKGCPRSFVASTASADDVARAVQVTWACELQSMPLHTLSSGSDSAAPSEMQAAAGVATVLEEALTVSWVFSQWGGIPQGCATPKAQEGQPASTKLQVTAASDQPAGIFPLTEAVFKEFTPDPQANRCDPGANIAAAARAFSAGERVEIGKTRDSTRLGDRTEKPGPGNPVIGGWQAMPWALGSDDADLIRSDGPLSFAADKFKPTDACAKAVNDWIDKQGTQIANVTFTPTTKTISTADATAVAASVKSLPEPTAACQVRPSAMSSFYLYIASKAQQAGRIEWNAASAGLPTTTTVPTTGSSSLVPPTTAGGVAPSTTAPVLTAAQQPGARKLALGVWMSTRTVAQSSSQAPTAEPAPAVAGVNTIISRLSPVMRPLPSHPKVDKIAPDAYATKVVLLARRIGGIVVGDPLAKLGDPWSVLKTASYGSLSASSCMPQPVAAAIDTASKLWPERAPQEAASGAKIPVEMVLGSFLTESHGLWDRIGPDGNTGVIAGVEGTVAGFVPSGKTFPTTENGIRGTALGGGDTDGGRYDGSASVDYAIGPAQFIPDTWIRFMKLYNLDANNDGNQDPNNAFDAALGAFILYARTANGGDLGADAGLREQAISQYSGFPLGSDGLANYMATRQGMLDGINECLAQHASIGSGTGQVEIGPDGCPLSMPQGTIPEGYDPYDICSRSVAAAPTAQAASAIKWAFAHAGYPYDQSQRNSEGFFDCASFVSRAYAATGLFDLQGNAPTTFTLGPNPNYAQVPWVVNIPTEEARPGDILIMSKPGREWDHAMMMLVDDLIIHTSSMSLPSRVEYVNPQWSTPWFHFRTTWDGEAVVRPNPNWRG